MMRVTRGLAPYQVLQRDRNGCASAVVGGTLVGLGATRLAVRVLRGGRPLRGFAGRCAGRAVNGRWTARLHGLPAGGPYTVVFQAGLESVAVPHVLVGDVWIMAGQSNMVGDGLVRDALPPHPLVHAFYAWDEWCVAREPVHFPAGAVDPVYAAQPLTGRAKILAAHRRAVKGAGLGVAFGRAMVRRTGVPQGLIPCAAGGTSLDQWSPRLRHKGGHSLYGAMLRRVRRQDQPVAGMLWYQGEADTRSDPRAYARKMRALILAVRKDLRLPALPWLMVQLGKTHLFDEQESEQPGFLAVREQQRRLAQTIRRLSVVPAIDLPMEDGIHLDAHGQIALGERLARVACFQLTAGRGARDGIALKRLRLVPCPLNWGKCPAIEVTFTHVTGGLCSDGVPSGFRLTTPDGKVLKRIHKVLLAGPRAVVVPYTYPDFSMKGYRLAYGYDLDAYCNIHDAEGMGLPAFAPQPIEPLPI